jgi:replicative DNA helicase
MTGPAMPFDKKSENFVIGYLVTSPDAARTVFELCPSENLFFQPQAAEVYRLCRTLLDAGEGWTSDDLVIDQRLSSNARAYIVDDVCESQASVDVDKASKMLAKMATLRDIMHKCERLQTACKEPGADLVDILADLTEQLDGWKGITPSGSMDGAALVQRAQETFQARKDGQRRPVKTPWKSLDDALCGGFQPGNLYVLVAGTGAGKTQFAITLTDHQVRQNKGTCHYIAMEADATELVCRLTALQQQVSWSKLYAGQADYPLVKAADLERLTTSFPRPGQWRPDTDLRRIRSDLVIVDFLQLCGAPGADSREAISAAAYACRDHARRTQSVVLILSSIARTYYPLYRFKNDKGESLLKPDNKGNPEKSPWEFLGTGKESGDIEHAATGVLVLPRDDNFMHLGLAKHRLGETKWVERFRFDGSTFTPVNQTDRYGR